jgi:hypothetical protein
VGTSTAVALEIGKKKVFASALEWPGWSRSGKTEELAIAALGEYATRFAPVAKSAGKPLTRAAGTNFEIVEWIPGDASTEFGVPGRIAAAELAPVDARQARLLVAFVVAAWDYFAQVAAGAPAELRKGPRGGGRDRDKMVAHVEDADVGYSRRLGIPLIKDSAEVRKAIGDAIGTPNDGQPHAAKGWPTRYAARRIAWHALDHAWEMEDKS